MLLNGRKKVKQREEHLRETCLPVENNYSRGR
jgi:hypothetical protein